jgi:predicted negative regulator of RcsB-dependent stress response
MKSDDKHMIIAIILALLLVAGYVLYAGSNQPKQNTSAIQYLSIAPATNTYDPTPPINYS